MNSAHALAYSEQSTSTIGRLAGRTAVVTGAGSGIGRALAGRLAAEGATVAAVDIDDPSATVDEIQSAGGAVQPFLADVSDPGAVAALGKAVTERIGGADILVNNAGIYPRIDFADIGIDAWRRVFAVNVESMLLMAQAFAPGMQQRGWGRIINVGSNTTAMQVPGATHYIASKMAVVGLTRGLATELAASGITANTIAPSITRTPGTVSGMPDEGFAALAQMQSIKRTELPKDLTGTVAFLASDDAAFMTGQVLYVDGGLVRSS